MAQKRIELAEHLTVEELKACYVAATDAREARRLEASANYIKSGWIGAHAAFGHQWKLVSPEMSSRWSINWRQRATRRCSSSSSVWIATLAICSLSRGQSRSAGCNSGV